MYLSNCRLHNIYFPLLLVSLFVEFIEEEEKHDSMHANEPYKCTRVVAVDEQQLEGMYHNCYKLDLMEKEKLQCNGK
jgi:hypothetical protein